LIGVVKKRWDELPTSALVTALNTVADLGADDETHRPLVRDFLGSHVNDPRERLQIAAIRGLGTLRDEKAIPLLEGFAGAAKETPTRNPAEFAINAIRSGRRPGNESQVLRTEVMDLKKENRELREELKTLSKKVEAISKPAPVASKEKSKPAAPKKPTKAPRS
jgi:hypothetical protein